ncbi:hypothetical protein [Streptomyces vinaceus]|uniref:hypothetical protein n=1 Tax=Streptomyces vinaceus TaxID=1960 RepID=UPI003815380B
MTLWHNLHRDRNRGYQPWHPMLRVYAYTVHGRDATSELWRAMEMFNAGLHCLTGDEHHTALDYRIRGLRSLSRADGISVRTAGTKAEEFHVNIGCQLRPHQGPYPTPALHGTHGSRPWGTPVTYLLPAHDNHVHTGLFEYGEEDTPATARRAVAVHHGLAEDRVVLLPAQNQSTPI